jgi:hypothetical protein
MINLHKYCICFFLLFLSQLRGQEQWDLVKEDEGIKVFTRTNEVMSFKEFKASVIVKGEVNQFVSVLYDVKGLATWGHNISEARLLERPSDTIQIYYAVAKAPWPYKNRDGIYKNNFSWDAVHRTLTVEISLLEDNRELSDKFVRMDGYGYWKVKEISANELQIDFQMQVDPGGSIKAWMANMFVTDSPFYTMKGIRDAMRLKQYQGKSYEFLGK